jgi:hypothetical protein
MRRSGEFAVTLTLDHAKALLDGDPGMFGWLGAGLSEELSNALIRDKLESVRLLVDKRVAECFARASADAIRKLHPTSPVRARVVEQMHAIDDWLGSSVVDRLSRV